MELNGEQLINGGPVAIGGEREIWPRELIQIFLLALQKIFIWPGGSY
jgi:hypothetical protein